MLVSPPICVDQIACVFWDNKKSSSVYTFQSKPIVPLQSEYNKSKGMHVLTCYMFPQEPLPEEDNVSMSKLIIAICHIWMVSFIVLETPKILIPFEYATRNPQDYNVIICHLECVNKFQEAFLY